MSTQVTDEAWRRLNEAAQQAADACNRVTAHLLPDKADLGAREAAYEARDRGEFGPQVAEIAIEPGQRSCVLRPELSTTGDVYVMFWQDDTAIYGGQEFRMRPGDTVALDNIGISLSR